MAIPQRTRFRLKKLTKELEAYRGRHTELVSVYIPQGYDMNKIINHLAQEQGTASNIKSSATRKNVTDALEKMIQYLKLHIRTPVNGMAVFSGNVAEREGQTDIRVWAVEPPVPLKMRLYRCDKQFIVDPLKDMCEDTESYGLVVMDRRDATIALLKGKSIIPLARTHSEVPGKFKAGGQSAQRFARLREGAAKDHYKKVGEYMKAQFFERKDLKGIIVGGPGPTKYEFVDGNYITAELKKKIIAIKDLSYTDEFGLHELLEKSYDVLATEEVAEEKKLLERFFTLLSTKPKMASYGMQHVMKNLEIGAVDVLMVSESLDDKTIEELEKKCDELGAEMKMISIETREGVQLKEIGGIAAILRYEVQEF